MSKRIEGINYFQELTWLTDKIGVDIKDLVSKGPVVCFEVGDGPEYFCFGDQAQSFHANEPGGHRASGDEISAFYELELSEAQAAHPHLSPAARDDNATFLQNLEGAGIRPNVITQLNIFPESLLEWQLPINIDRAVHMLSSGGVFVMSTGRFEVGDAITDRLNGFAENIRESHDCSSCVIIPENEYGNSFSSGGAFLLVKKHK
jgi:hypothetical protein